MDELTNSIGKNNEAEIKTEMYMESHVNVITQNHNLVWCLKKLYTTESKMYI